MKTVSYLFILAIAVAMLTACESGQGPNKPASSQSLQISK